VTDLRVGRKRRVKHFVGGRHGLRPPDRAFKDREIASQIGIAKGAVFIG